MAHYAEVIDGTVTKVVVVSNGVTTTDGVEVEQDGIDFLNDLLPGSGPWVQTSYNRGFRTHFAGIGMTYDATRDAFLHDSPFPSWVLNEGTLVWEPPTPPVPGYGWDEATTSWVQPPQPYPSWTWEDDYWQFPGDPPDDLTKNYVWDEDTTSWVEVE